MSLLLGALTLGLILALLGIGVYISFRIFNFPDMTCEGTYTLGAAVAAVVMLAGHGPLGATAAGMVAGALAGAVTGLVHTRLKVNDLLAGILVMTGLYSVNLRVMGSSNLSLSGTTTLTGQAASLGTEMAGGAKTVQIFGHDAAVGDLAMLVLVVLVVVAVTALLLVFFKTQLGLAMRGTGDNAQMIRALGVGDGNMQVLGLAISNALAALAGALAAQYLGFVDIGMGLGMLVAGLAAVILGETLVSGRTLAVLVVGTALGALVYRLLIAVALRLGMEPNDLKIITAVFVLGALVAPVAVARWRERAAVRAAAG